MHNDYDRDGWRRFENMARKGFGRFASNLGDFNFLDHRFKISRMLASGDLRLVALYFIEQQPRHGYDLIKAIEEKSGGVYSPSPGVVYPALTFLQESDYVTATQEGNKKSYTITDSGRNYRSDNREAIDSTLGFLGMAAERVRTMRERWSDAGDHLRRSFDERSAPTGDRDIPGVLPEVNEARRVLKAAIAEAVAAGEGTQRRLADVLRRAAEDIRNLREPESRDSDIDL